MRLPFGEVRMVAKDKEKGKERSCQSLIIRNNVDT